MLIGSDESCPLPDDPVVAEMAVALDDSGHWGIVVDDGWRIVYMSDEMRRTFAGSDGLSTVVVGAFMFGSEHLDTIETYRFGGTTKELWRGILEAVGDLVLADTLANGDELRALVDPALGDVVDGLSPADPATAISFLFSASGLGGTYETWATAVRIRDHSGVLRGTALVFKPAAGMHTLATMAFQSDLEHLERMQSLTRAGRRPAALLFADLEGSSLLARRLSTANNFALGRRLVRAADQCIVDAGGVVGRHAGDGVVAFFPAETFDSESQAAQACIVAARAIRTATSDVAVRSDLAADEIVMRFGVHWGSTVHVGSITTSARSEITALGDEVNEAARIEACATGGRLLASKDLIERLDLDDATAIDLDPERVTYTRLADLETATDKARRDAPAIAVCEV